MTEATLERKFVSAIKRLGGYAIKFAPVGVKGFPDRIVLMPGGRIGFAELKNPSGRGQMSPAQVRATATLARLGFPVIVSHDFDELMEWVEKWKA